MTLFPKSIDAEARVDLSQWLDRGIVLAVLLACGVALSLNVADPDLWGHVQYGRDALARGLPLTTTYSYVAQGYPWINHEIVAEYVLALGNDWLGGPGLFIGKWLLGMGICTLILWRTRRQGAGLIAACSLTLLVAVSLGSHWSLRPQLGSYVCFTVLLALLSHCFAGWEGKWCLSIEGLLRLLRQPPATLLSLCDVRPQDVVADNQPCSYAVSKLKLLWLAAPLFLIWTNTHGGFLAGLCIYLAYLTLRGMEVFSHKGRKADGLLVRFGLMGAAAAAATFLNPYGPRFHWWLYNDLKVPRPEIVEWRAPELFNSQFIPLWILIAVAIASLALTRRTRDFTQVTILGLILWQALTHHRHSAFLALACGWWLPLHFDSMLARLGVGQRFKTDEELMYGWAPPESQAFTAAFSPRMQQWIAALLVVAICVSTGQLANRLTLLKVERDNYPVAAFEYIGRQGLTGKMVCTFNWAQYALAAFGPREPGQPGILVQIDGRCRTSYSQAMLDAHFDFLLGNVGPEMRYRDPQSGPFDPTRVLHDERPDLVLISRLQRPSVEVMEQQKENWVLLYQDRLAQLWGRSSRYNDPASAFYLPLAKREPGNSAQVGYVRWPALPEYRPATPGEPTRTSMAATVSDR